jgi:hypothetical protein
MANEQNMPINTAPQREGLPKDDARLQVMRRVKNMTVEERLALFEQLSRDAAWARTATRLR